MPDAQRGDDRRAGEGHFRLAPCHCGHPGAGCSCYEERRAEADAAQDGHSEHRHQWSVWAVGYRRQCLTCRVWSEKDAPR